MAKSEAKLGDVQCIRNSKTCLGLVDVEAFYGGRWNHVTNTITEVKAEHVVGYLNELLPSIIHEARETRDG